MKGPAAQPIQGVLDRLREMAVPGPQGTVRLRLRKLYAASPAGVTSSFGVGLANGAIWAVGAVFARESGLGIFETSLFMAGIVLGGALSQWPWGWLSDKTDRRRVMLLCAIGAAATGLGLWFLGHNGAFTIIGLAVVFGAFAFPLNSLSIAHTNDHVPREDAVETAGALNLTYGIGAIIGPIIAATLMNLTRPEALFGYTASVHIVIAGIIAWRLRAHHAPLKGEKQSFRIVANTSPEAFKLDPRAPSPEK